MLVRAALVFVAPFILAWVVLERVCRELRPIPVYIRNDIAENIAQMRACWRAKSFDTRKWL